MAVAYDNKTELLDQAASAGATFSHTINGSSNTAVVVFIAISNAIGARISSITYNATNCPQIGTASAASNSSVTAFGVPTGSTTGAHDVVVTLTDTTDAWDAIAVSFTGVLQTGGTSTFAGIQTGSTLSASADHITLTVASATGDLVIHGTCSIANDGSTATPLWQNNSGSSNTQGKTAAGAAPSVEVTDTWTASADGYSMVAFNIVQVSASTTPITVNTLPVDSLAGGEIV